MTPEVEVPFPDRAAAGRHLARRLVHLADEDVVVLGLPRGGVPVAFEVARVLRAPLDVLVVRKVGLPSRPELAVGAVAEDGYEVLDAESVRSTGTAWDDVTAVREQERAAVAARVRQLRAVRPPVDLAGRTAVVVDDGIATGATARVACQVARHRGASRVVLAAPVGPVELLSDDTLADELVVLVTPEPFLAVGRWYRDFVPTTDDEVVDLLLVAARTTPPAQHG